MLNDVDVFKLVPPHGFFPRYLRYAAQLTDAPEIYHVMSSLAVFSAITASYTEVVFPSLVHMLPEPGSIILPADTDSKLAYSPTPWWGLVVGPSGDRKTTAMNLALGVTKDANGISILQDQLQSVGSPEATFDAVGRVPNSFFFYPEGATLFNLFKASYWAQGQGLFPQLYDGDDMHRKLAGARTKKDPNPEPMQIDITRPRVTLLCGVATPHLDTAQSTDWDGGLIARMMLIFAERKRFEPIAGRRDDKERMALHQLLLQIRENLIKHPGTFRIGMKADAGKMYVDWTRKIDAAMSTKAPKIRSLFNRLPNHVLRVAAHYAVSQGYNAIDAASMSAALALGNYSASSVDYLGTILTDDRTVRLITLLRELLSKNGKEFISYREIMHKLGVSKQALRFPIESLLAAGEVKILTSQVHPNQQWLKRIKPDEKEPTG